MNQLNWSPTQCIFRLLPLVITISFAMDVYVPAIPEMTHYFKTTGQSMQASLYLFMLTVSVGQLVIGPLSDHFGRRPIALTSAYLFVIGSLLPAYAESMPLLLFGRVIQALGACGTYISCFIVIRDNYSTKECGRMFSILSGSNSIAASTAPVIGGILLDLTSDWRSEFYCLTLIALVVGFATYKNIPKYTFHKQEQSDSLLRTWLCIFQNRYFQRYSFIATTGMLGLYIFCAISPEILITKLNLSGTQYGLWFGLNASTAFAANFIAARLTYRFPLEKIVLIGLWVISLGTLAMLSLYLYKLSVLNFMMPMLTTTVGIGLSMGCATALALKDFESIAGTATSLVGALQFGIAGLIGAIAVQWTPTPLTFALPVLSFALIGLCIQKLL